MSHETSARKLDHLRIAFDRDVEYGDTLLGEVELVYNPLPETCLDTVNTTTTMLGKRLSAPLMVTAITGGHVVATELNCSLAEAVEELGLAMGVGSQRAGLEDQKLVETFRVVRRCAPTTVIIANIGFMQLVKDPLAVAEKVVEMIEADALAVHVNTLQELFQPEGERCFEGALRVLELLTEKLDVPVIVKEVGHGLPGRVVRLLRGLGVRYFDVAGLGGTNWVYIESVRTQIRGEGMPDAHTRDFLGIGTPTAQAVVEARWNAPDACIIASGGIRSSLDVAKSLALGANIAGLALPALRAYMEAGKEGVKRLLETLVYGLKKVMTAVGARSIEELRRTPLILGSRLVWRLEQVGVNINLYEAVRTSMLGVC